MSFERLRRILASGAPSFSPFFMLGDPEPDTSLEIARAAIAAGSQMLELGIPFSDPCADGPSVQAACTRARAAGTTVDRSFELMATLRRETDVPFNLLVYGNLVHQRGWDRFASDAVSAGASSVLVPDVPLEEGADLVRACADNDLGLVQFAGPSTSPERLAELGDAATGFLYLAGRQGTTGARDDIPKDTRRSIRVAVESQPAAVCVGFGLKSRTHVEAVFDAGARIAIVGSALLDHIAAAVSDGAVQDRGALLQTIERETRALCAAGTEEN